LRSTTSAATTRTDARCSTARRRERHHQRHDHAAQDDLPFGGVGESGIGKYHGIEGFRTLSHAKGIFEQGRWNFIELLRAPFGKRAAALLNFLR
jgi:hypothetical protein